MRRSLSFSTALIACLASSFARAEEPKLDLDFGIPSGTAMLCQFDRKVSETKKKKIEEQVVNFAVISGKSAQLCDGEGKADDEAMDCKRFEYVGKNDGGSIIFVSDDGYKLTTNLLALAFGAGVSVKDLNGLHGTLPRSQYRRDKKGDASIRGVKPVSGDCGSHELQGFICRSGRTCGSETAEP